MEEKWINPIGFMIGVWIGYLYGWANELALLLVATFFVFLIVLFGKPIKKRHNPKPTVRGDKVK